MLLFFIQMLRVRNSKGSDGESVQNTKLLGWVMVGISVEVVFMFGHLEFNLYNLRSVCKYHYAIIHFPCPSRSFSRPELEAWKNCYNASMSRELARFTRMLQVTPQKEVTPKVVPTKWCNPVLKKGRRKVAQNPGGSKAIR